jgi:ATP-binding protein involved in chromosome partitioning
MLDTNAVLEALRPVNDPELQKSLVELNMIRQVKVTDGVVSFDLVLTTPACPLKGIITDDCRRAVTKLEYQCHLRDSGSKSRGRSSGY